MSATPPHAPRSNPLVWIALAGIGLALGVVVLRSPPPEVPAPAAVYGPSAAVSAPGRESSLWNLPIPPLVSPTDLDAREVALGRELFHEQRLSADGSVSCATCHDIASGGDDGRRFSVGIRGRQGELNAPTVLNSGNNFRQFWDGRARTLEEQVDGPLEHADEMGSTWEHVLAFLSQDPTYSGRFREVYGAAPTKETVRRALATFERSLVTPDSPFDRYLLGETDALSEDARAGYGLFVDLGCIACHQGANAGGNMFQPFGKMSDYFADREQELRARDNGRFNVTGRERDRHTFKVPSLRNVGLTAPYFHDGSATSLEEAVRVMAEYQLGEEIDEREVDQLVAFLESLTGHIPSMRD